MASDFATINDDLAAANPRQIAVDAAPGGAGVMMPDGSFADIQLLRLALGGTHAAATKFADGFDLGDGTKGLHVTERSEIVQSAFEVPAITAASAYVAGYAVGSTIDFGTVARRAGAGVNVMGLMTIDESKQFHIAGGQLLVFGAAPTAAVDHTAYDPSHADLTKLLGIFSYFGQWMLTSSRSVANNFDNFLYGVSTDGHLYGQLVTAGTPTFVSVADIAIQLTVQRY